MIGAAKDYTYAVDDVAARYTRRFCHCDRRQYSVRDFIRWSAEELGLTVKFEGQGLEEIGRVVNKVGNLAPAVQVGDVIISIDPRYFRPAEVDTLLGDPNKAKTKLGWLPEIGVREMCSEMAQDLKDAQRFKLLHEHD